MSIRKIQRLGTSSLIITIPKDWARRVGVKPGDTVYIIETNKGLEIIPLKKGEPGIRVVYCICSKDEKDLKNSIDCLLRLGFKEVEVLLPNGNGNLKKIVTETVLKTGTYKVERVLRDRVLLRLTANPEEREAEEMLKEMSSVVSKGLRLLENMLDASRIPEEATREINKVMQLTEKLGSKIEGVMLQRLELIKGNLIEERREAVLLSIIILLQSIMKLIIGMIRELVNESCEFKTVIVRRNQKNLLKAELYRMIRSLDDALWEITGGISNRSLKRIEEAERRLNEMREELRKSIIKRESGCPEVCMTISFVRLLTEQLLFLSKRARCLFALQRSLYTERKSEKTL